MENEEALEYTLQEIQDYVASKFKVNNVRRCQIMNETGKVLTIKFQPVKVHLIDKWLYPNRFEKIVTKGMNPFETIRPSDYGEKKPAKNLG